MGNIVTIDFHGDRLLGIETNGAALIPLRPLVLGMGLDWSAQLQRVRRHAILGPVVVMTPTTASPAGDKLGACLPLDCVLGFLFTIDASRVNEAVRGKVLDYQRHCFAVLARAFLRPSVSEKTTVTAPTEALPFDLARRLVTEARHTFDRQAGRELWFWLGLPVVPAMTAPPRQGSLFTYTADRQP